MIRGYDRARALLSEHRLAMEALAGELLNVESLDAGEIRLLLEANGATPPAGAGSPATLAASGTAAV